MVHTEQNPDGRAAAETRPLDIDWYDRRDELEPGMVFTSCYGLVRLDHRVPGDGTDWIALTSYDEGKSWVADESRIHPGDLIEKIEA
jgi:hypothetical protein